MVGMVSSRYYRIPSLSEKGNKPSKLIWYKTKEWLGKAIVISSIMNILSHEFIDSGYRLMTSCLKK
jgi:hypothetical protein